LKLERTECTYTYPEITEGDARKDGRRGPVCSAVDESADDVDAVRVIRGTKQRVEHVQLTDHVADVQQLDEQVERHEVIAVMTTEHRTQQSRQCVLETERPLCATLTNETVLPAVVVEHTL